MVARNTQKAPRPARQSGVELLRILAALAVVVLHINYYPGGVGVADVATGVGRTALDLLECLCICAVNVFLLISGAFGSHARSVKVRKLGLLLLQTSAFRVAANLALSAYGGDWDLRRILGAFVPVNYYVILYVALMLLSPYLNAGLARLSRAALARLALIAFLTFSVFATAVDVAKEVSGEALSGLSPIGIDGSMGGYTIVNFALVYLLGAWLRREEAALRQKLPTPLLLVAVAALCLLLLLWRRVLPGTAWMYSNPLVILEGCAVFLLFSRLRFSSGWINRIAPAAFTCYLIHGYALSLVSLERLGALPLPLVLGGMLVGAAGIYALSVAVHFIWSAAVDRLFRPGTERLTISVD